MTVPARVPFFVPGTVWSYLQCCYTVLNTLKHVLPYPVTERSDSIMIGHKKHYRLWLSLLAALLTLTFIPFSALAQTGSTNEEPREILWSSEYPYQPYPRTFPERGTTPEDTQYRLPRLSDAELERMRELIVLSRNVEEILIGIRSCANLAEDVSIGVYPLDPNDFDGETFYVILPDSMLTDEQMLSLIAGFKELGIPFNPDSLNERNCIRLSYWGGTRGLSPEEQERLTAQKAKIVRGQLKRKDIKPESACLTVKTLADINNVFCFYPYRSLSDDELAAFAMSDLSAWETSADLIEETALNNARGVLPLPEKMPVKDVKMTEVTNCWDTFDSEKLNEYEIFFDHPTSYTSGKNSGGKVADVLVWLYEEPGKPLETEGMCIRYFLSGDSGTGRSESDWIASAEKWTKENLTLPEDKKPSNWTVHHVANGTVYLDAETEDWDFRLWMQQNNAQVSVCYIWSMMFR